jgi:hypothetical protein
MARLLPVWMLAPGRQQTYAIVAYAKRAPSRTSLVIAREPLPAYNAVAPVSRHAGRT